MSVISKYVGFTVGNSVCGHEDPLLLDDTMLAEFIEKKQASVGVSALVMAKNGRGRGGRFRTFQAKMEEVMKSTPILAVE